MRKLLIFLLILGLIGMAGAVTKTLPNFGPANGFYVKQIQTQTITADTITSGTNVTSGVFQDDLSLAADKNFVFLSGVGNFDVDGSSGYFNTTTGAHYINGNLTGASGKTWTIPTATIMNLTATTISNAAITSLQANDTDHDALLASTLVNETAINDTVDDLQAADTAINSSIDSLTVAAFVNETAINTSIGAVTTARVANKQSDYVNQTAINTSIGAVTTARIANKQSDYVNQTATNASLSAMRTATYVNETAINASIDALEVPIASFDYSASSVDQGIFAAKGAWTLTGARLTPRVLGTDEGAVSVQVKLCDSGEAPASGDAMLSAGLDLKGTADTPQSGTLSATVGIAAGKVVALDFTGTLTSAVGTITLYGVRS